MALKLRAKSDYSRSMYRAMRGPRPTNVKEITVKNAELKSRKDAATPRGVGVMCDFYAERAYNAELWDVEGRRFIDFAAGIAVLNTGHRHPRVMAAIAEKAARSTHTCYRVVPYENSVPLAERINALPPGSHAKKTAFFSS